eukprot:scaffold246705_cov16-Prasinocladus_malaysianus.AAC.1
MAMQQYVRGVIKCTKSLVQKEIDSDSSKNILAFMSYSGGILKYLAVIASSAKRASRGARTWVSVLGDRTPTFVLTCHKHPSGRNRCASSQAPTADGQKIPHSIQEL